MELVLNYMKTLKLYENKCFKVFRFSVNYFLYGPFWQKLHVSCSHIYFLISGFFLGLMILRSFDSY